MEGTAAVYGKESLYKVASVSAIAFVKDENQKQQGKEHKRESKNFGAILANALSSTSAAEDIQVSTHGYTRNAMPTVYLVNMRDYTYQGQ